ncbi:MAG: hypothetical protein QXK43_09625 [Candidatus Jordarchaeales archaeon]
MKNTLQALSFRILCPECGEDYSYRVFVDTEIRDSTQRRDTNFSLFFDHGDHWLEVSLNGEGKVVGVRAVPYAQARGEVFVWRRENPYFPVFNSSLDVLFADRNKRTYCDLNWRDDALSFLPLVEGGRTSKYVVNGREYWILAHESNVVVVKRCESWGDDVFNRLAALVREFRNGSVSTDSVFQRIFISVLEAVADDPYITSDAVRLINDLGKTISINLDLIMLSPVPFGGDLVELLASVGHETIVDFLVLSASGVKELVKLIKTYRLFKNLNLVKVVE